MRLVSWNVENFFARPRAMRAESRAAGAAILAAHAELNRLLDEPAYPPNVQARILELLGILGLAESDAAEMAVTRQVRGRLLLRPRSGVPRIVATGRGDWVGWVDLTTEPATEAAVLNTARVIRDLEPAILGVVEAENRVVLKHFSDAQLRTSVGVQYPHVMLIDGNDDRGIDVAILTQPQWPLGTVRSHVDDSDDGGSSSAATALSTRYARRSATAS